MYKNVGGKLKGIATILCILGIAASVIGGIIFLFVSRFRVIPMFFVIVITGSLASWLGSIALYAYGELIESNSQTRDYMKKTMLLIEKMAKNQGSAAAVSEDTGSVKVRPSDKSQKKPADGYQKPAAGSAFSDPGLNSFFAEGQGAQSAGELLDLWHSLGLGEKPYADAVEEYLTYMEKQELTGKEAVLDQLKWIEQTILEAEANSEKQEQTVQTMPQQPRTSGRRRGSR